MREADRLVIGDLTLAGFALVAAAITLASAFQGSIGFGMGTVAAPLIAIVEPRLIPVTIIVLAVVATATVAAVERQAIDLRGTGWALAGRIPGSFIGALLVVLMSDRLLAILLALVVLGGVALSVRGWAPEPVPGNVVAAGVASGILGTATAIGGPPMALVWQGKDGPGLRGTMNGFFLVGSIVSLASLAVAGAVPHLALVAAAALLPFVALGFACSRFLNRLLDRHRLRLAALAMSCLGAVVLLAHQL